MKGKITAIKGIVVEVKFEEQSPKVYDALIIEPKNSNGDTVVIEVLQLLDDGVVRGIAMNATDGIRRGDSVTNTGDCINVPVGENVLGHIFNAL